jgi:heme-degrading monooxygenase HmoA
MSAYFVSVSFQLNPGKLEDWKAMSAEIDKDIAIKKGFVSRDSGIDENNLVYCLVKWQSKDDQEAFKRSLEAQKVWSEMMENFANIVDMTTMESREIDLF